MKIAYVLDPDFTALDLIGRALSGRRANERRPAERVER